MENSRHDRVIVIVSSYIIGFTSAFIAFGLTNTSNNNLKLTTSDFKVAHEVANVVESEKKTASLHIEADGLVVVTPEGERLLSARKTPELAASVIASKPGYAVKLTEAELSRDSKYVYFCEQLSSDTETCDPYVYSLSEDVLHPVKVGGEDYKPVNETHHSAWSPAGFLTLDGHISTSIAEPWVLQ